MTPDTYSRPGISKFSYPEMEKKFELKEFAETGNKYVAVLKLILNQNAR